MTRGVGPKIATAAAALCCVGLWGCGLFNPRDPLSGGGPGTVCLTPTTPSAVVANVQVNYALPAGVTCYTSMLDAAFAFHPDGADSLEALPDTVYAHWNRDVESRVATNLASNATFRSVVFDSEYAAPSVSPDQRTEVHFFVYHIVVKPPPLPPAAPDTLFQGLADITFVQGANAQWHITDWTDRRDASGSKTWGYLRRLYRVGF